MLEFLRGNISFDDDSINEFITSFFQDEGNSKSPKEYTSHDVAIKFEEMTIPILAVYQRELDAYAFLHKDDYKPLVQNMKQFVESLYHQKIYEWDLSQLNLLNEIIDEFAKQINNVRLASRYYLTEDINRELDDQYLNMIALRHLYFGYKFNEDFDAKDIDERSQVFLEKILEEIENKYNYQFSKDERKKILKYSNDKTSTNKMKTLSLLMHDNLISGYYCFTMDAGFATKISENIYPFATYPAQNMRKLFEQVSFSSLSFEEISQMIPSVPELRGIITEVFRKKLLEERLQEKESDVIFFPRAISELKLYNVSDFLKRRFKCNIIKGLYFHDNFRCYQISHIINSGAFTNLKYIFMPKSFEHNTELFDLLSTLAFEHTDIEPVYYDDDVEIRKISDYLKSKDEEAR